MELSLNKAQTAGLVVILMMLSLITAISVDMYLPAMPGIVKTFHIRGFYQSGVVDVKVSVQKNDRIEFPASYHQTHLHNHYQIHALRYCKMQEAD